jgi:phosphoglycerate dehydrogenase-like enzyme
MPKVFVFAPSGNMDSQLREAGCDTALGEGHWHAPGGNYLPEMLPMAKDAEAFIGTSNRASPIVRALLEASPELRVVAKSTIGVDDIDVDACTERGILVTHAPVESNWGNIAEITVTFILNLAKNVQAQDAYIKGGGWHTPGVSTRYIGSRASDDFPGMTLGIIGLGRIGTRLAHLMRPWNMRILAYDPYIPRHRFLEAEAKQVDLQTLLRESDIVTIHVILTKETRNMLGAREIAMMKPGSILINTARGGLIDEEALADALESRHLSGAGLNAFAQEPLAAESRLRGLGDKVLMLPHGGYGLMPGFGSTNPGREGVPAIAGSQATDWSVECVLDALRGEVPEHVYNIEVVPRWLARFGGKDILKPAPMV